MHHALAIWSKPLVWTEASVSGQFR